MRIHMHKIPACMGYRCVIRKQPHLIAHAALAYMRDADACGDALREADGREVVALGFDDKADDGALFDVERALLDQVAIDCRVKPCSD
jgi:hypothetical protein